MTERVSWMTFAQYQATETFSLSQLGPASRDGYRMVGVDQLPGWFPVRLIPKTHDIILIVRTTSSSPLLVANVRRYDLWAGTIDEQPFGFVYNPASPSAQSSGAWIDHGSWPCRTSTMPVHVQFALATGGTARGIPLPTDPPSSAGPLAELYGTSHQWALEAVIRQLT